VVPLLELRPILLSNELNFGIGGIGIAEKGDSGRFRVRLDPGELFVGEFVYEGGFAHLESADDCHAVAVGDFGQGEGLFERRDLVFQERSVAGKVESLGFLKFVSECDCRVADGKKRIRDEFVHGLRIKIELSGHIKVASDVADLERFAARVLVGGDE
jgi:hypothetical protein